MPYASLEDVNTHLPIDKAQALDGQIPNLLIDAERLIRARLASVFEIATLNAWSTPSTTPELIREIAGKLVAAKFYANLVAEDEADGSAFAQNLYNEAIMALNDLRDGNLTLIGVGGIEIASAVLSETSFYPNNDAPDPSFSVEEVWS